MQAIFYSFLLILAAYSASAVTAPQPLLPHSSTEQPINVSPAPAISLDSIGLYTEADGGLSPLIWQGSNVEEIKTLLQTLPSKIDSDVIRKLVVTLLLTTTQAPKSENIQQNFFTERVQALLRMQQTQEALAMLKHVPSDRASDAVEKQRLTAHLLAQDTQAACAMIPSALKRFSVEDVFWRKAQLFCLATQQKHDEAYLVEVALREQGIEVSPPFAELIQRMLDSKLKGKQIFSSPLSLEDMAMIRLGKAEMLPKTYVISPAPLPMTQGVINSKLQYAMANKRIGEVILLSAILSQEKPDAALVGIALRSVGLEDKAAAYEEARSHTQLEQP